MNGSNDITPKLRSWLKEPVTLREDGVDKVLELVHETRQRRGWLSPLPEGRLGRVLVFAGGAATGLVAVLLGGLLLLALSTSPEPGQAPGVAPSSPSPSVEPSRAPPDWPGVAFEPVADACADRCDWVDGGVWEVSADHHGDFGSTQAIAFGPDGAPWFLSDDTLWQLGVPEVSALPGTSREDDQVSDLAVADDGTLWVASDFGLHSFDGRTWTEHWTGARLTDVDVTSNGEVIAVGGGRVSGLEEAETHPIVAIRFDGEEAGILGVDVLPERVWPMSVAATSDGQLWVSAVESGYVPTAEGESLVAHFDGQVWETVRPLGPDVDVAAWSLAPGPDGTLWASLLGLPAGGRFESYLANNDGGDWTLHETEELDALNLRVGPGGEVWFAGGDTEDGAPGGVVVFDGQAWTRYLEGEWIGPLAVAPDGTAFVATIPGFDEDGRLFAIRPSG